MNKMVQGAAKDQHPGTEGDYELVNIRINKRVTASGKSQKQKITGQDDVMKSDGGEADYSRHDGQ